MAAMLTIERTRELLATLNLSEKEIEEIRVLSWLLAGVTFDASQKRQEKENERKSEGNAGSSS